MSKRGFSLRVAKEMSKYLYDDVLGTDLTDKHAILDTHVSTLDGRLSNLEYCANKMKRSKSLCDLARGSL